MFRDKCTIVLPVLKVDDFAVDCIEHLLSVCDLDVLVICEEEPATPLNKNKRLTFFLNEVEEKQSLVKLWNTCIKKCPSEYVIIPSWRCRPTEDDFALIEEKINEGYGMVDLAALHFFCIGKHLTTVLGFFDEGFKYGQYEDTDWYNRFYMNDIAMYCSNSMEQVPRVSTWLYKASENEKYYHSKWTEDDLGKTLTQHNEEENISDRSLYSDLPEREYLKFEKSMLVNRNLENYYTIFSIKKQTY